MGWRRGRASRVRRRYRRELWLGLPFTHKSTRRTGPNRDPRTEFVDGGTRPRSLGDREVNRPSS